jgi:preprotein translocase subunit SecA
VFQDLRNTIWSDFTQMIYNVEVKVQVEYGQADAVPPAAGPRRRCTTPAGRSTTNQPSAYGGDRYEAETPEPSPVNQQRRVDEHEQLGRNDPVLCGSGKK